MNEAQLLLYLLSRKRDTINIGSSENEIVESLGITDRNALFKLHNLLEELNSNIEYLGLEVKYNPASNYWFIKYRDNFSDVFPNSSISNLSSSLAATLFSILLISISDGEKVTKKKVADARNKSDINDDLKALEELGYIKRTGNSVRLTAKLFYYIDIDDIAEEIKKFKSEPDN